jgi:hypothetical protein
MFICSETSHIPTLTLSLNLLYLYFTVRSLSCSSVGNKMGSKYCWAIMDTLVFAFTFWFHDFLHGSIHNFYCDILNHHPAK